MKKTANDGYFSSSFTIEGIDETTVALLLFGNVGQSGETGVKIDNIQLHFVDKCYVPLSVH